MSLAEEVRWSMDDLNFQFHRLLGCVEGNVKNLHDEGEEILKIKAQNQQSAQGSVSIIGCTGGEGSNTISQNMVTPPAPVAVKRRRRMLDEESAEEERKTKRTARKLEDDFDRLAMIELKSDWWGCWNHRIDDQESTEEKQLVSEKENRTKSKAKSSRAIPPRLLQHSRN